MTESQYDEVVQALTDMNVKLVDVNGNYRDTYDVFKDIAAQWDKMSSIDQAALATKLSGTRMQAVFYSLVQNFGEAEKAMEAMADAEGTLVEKNEVFANSIEGRMNQFRNEFKKLATEIFTSDWIKDAVDIAKTLISGIANIAKALTSVVKALGGIKVVLPVILGYYTMFKIAKAVKNLTSMANAISTLITEGKALSTVQKIMLAGNSALATSSVKAAGAVGSLTKGLLASTKAFVASPLGALTIAGAVVTGTAIAISKYGEWYEKQSKIIEEAENKLADANQELSKAQDDVKTVSDELQTAKDRLEQLSQLSSPTYVEAAEIEKLKDTTQELERQLALLKEIEAEKQRDRDQSFLDLMDFGGNPAREKLYGELGLSEFLGASHTRPETTTASQNVLDFLLMLPRYFDFAAQDADILPTYGYDTSELQDVTTREYREQVMRKVLEKVAEWTRGIKWIEDPETQAEKDVNEALRTLYNIQDIYLGELGDDVGHQAAFARIMAQYGYDNEATFRRALEDGVESAVMAAEDLRTVGFDLDNLGEAFTLAATDGGKFSESMVALRSVMKDVAEAITGLDMLDKIYKDVMDGSTFDYTSLINDKFVEEFGGLGEVFDDFVQTVAQSPSDIGACQEAFNRLTKAYITQDKYLQNVSEETKDVVAQMLEEKGVANASAIVNQVLASNLYNVAVAKYQVGETKIDSTDDVDQLLKMAQAAGAAQEELDKLVKIRALVDKLSSMPIGSQQAMAYAHEVERLVAELKELTPESIELPDIVFTGGAETQKVRDAATKEAEKAAKNTKTWFEEQYAEHKHLVAMEKETDYEYYTWLEGAMKKAYAEGILSQEDYWKYEEEVYNGMKKLRENAEKEAQSNLDKLVDIRKKMLEKEVSDQKDALNDQLKNLKDFYDKQRKMLQGSYDEEDYLEEQAEKRKSVSDLEEELARLRYDDSAWAQKRRAEISQQLADARKELNDFERDHARDEALSFLDEQESAAEEMINAQIETLDEKYKSAKELYEQALADVKNGSVELYREMIKWNGEYGDGIDDTITKAWEGAYQALSDYNTLFGKTFKGVDLANATGYVLKPVGKGYASGTSYAVPGLHPIDEKGSETYFSPSTGGKYKMFSGGEKVLTAKASDFLYRFANGGSEMLKKFIAGVGGGVLNDRLTPLMTNNEIVMGDVIVNGNADRATVSEIRRAQRESVEFMLKEFGKLNR